MSVQNVSSQRLTNPWKAVSLIIAGAIVGYTFMLLQTDNAFAEGKTCKYHEKTVAAVQ